jgi:copper homeostasis protein
MMDEKARHADLTPILEVCCGSADFAIAAASAGANRVELCDNLVEGGTTPSVGAVSHTLERTDVPVMQMIRPRGGDFLYSDDEFQVMVRDIVAARELGVMGVVFGVLTAQGRVDRERTERLVDAARPLAVTFHRAFDLSRNLMESLDTLIEIGVDRVLTSAGKPSVFDGLPVLGDLVREAGDSLVVLPGGGIRAHNITRLFELPGIREVHIGASRQVPSSMTFRADGIPMGRAYEPNEYVREGVDGEAIRAIAAVFDGQRVDGARQQGAAS